MSYSENTPTYEAIQWTGTNLFDVQDFVDTRSGLAGINYYVHENPEPPEPADPYVGMLEAGLSNTWPIPDLALGLMPGAWVVHGPLWNDKPNLEPGPDFHQNNHRFFVVSDADFAYRFTINP